MGRYVELQHVRHGADPESGLSFVGPASYFVSYAWDTPWDSLVSALKAHSTRVMAEAAAAVSPSEQASQANPDVVSGFTGKDRREMIERILEEKRSLRSKTLGSPTR